MNNARVRIGDFREQFAIETQNDDQDPVTGGAAPAWTPITVDAIKGSAEYLSGSELERAQRINGAIQMKFTTWFRADVTNKCRVVWNSKSWNIHAVLPDDRRVFMALMASEEK